MGPDLPPAALDVESRAAAAPVGVDDPLVPPPSLAEGGATPTRRLASLAGPAHLISLVAAAPLLVWFNRNQWFFGDEWEFFANRTTGWGRVLFEPHNEHWSTGPILVYRALYAAVGVRSYVPYVVVLIALHLLAAHLLWRLMNRGGVAPVVATGLAAVFAVLGAGAENLLWAFQMGFVGSVAAGLGHLLLVDHPGPFGRRDRIGWVVAVAGLTFSGIGVTMTATAGLAVLLRRNARDAVATVVPPAAVYLLWLALVGHEGLGRGDGRATDVLEAPSYLWTGLGSALERSSGIAGAGGALVVVTVGWLLRQRAVRRTRRAPATAMAVGAAALLVLLAVGRAGYGAAQATSSRYVYIALALLLPAIGLMLSDVTRGVAARQLVVVGLLVPVLVHNVGELRELSHGEADRERAVRGQVLAAASLLDGDDVVAGAQPEPRFSPDVTVDVLRRLRRQGALPAATDVGEVDLLTASTHLQVTLAELPPPAGPGGEGPPSVGVAVDDRGCLLAGPFGAPPVDVALTAGQAVSVALVAGGEVAVSMRSPSGSGVSGRPRLVELAPGAVRWLGATRDTTLSITVPGPAAAELCGVRAR